MALAGTGGPNLPTEEAAGIEAFLGFYGGPSASIVRIEAGCPVTVADGLPSYIDGTGGIIGVSDVATLGGQLYATVDGGGRCTAIRSNRLVSIASRGRHVCSSSPTCQLGFGPTQVDRSPATLTRMARSGELCPRLDVRAPSGSWKPTRAKCYRSPQTARLPRG